MGVVKTILFVAFIIISVILVLLVLVQNEDNNGMGSVFGGGQSAAFGSHGASVLTKTTAVFVALFFIVAFGLALLNKPNVLTTQKDTVTETAAQEGVTAEEGTSSTSWLDDVAPAADTTVEAAPEATEETEAVEETAAEPVTEVAE